MRTNNSILWGAALVVGAVAACGGGGGGGGDDIDAAAHPDAAATPDANVVDPDAAVTASASGTIGASGGTLTLEDVTITFPAGAVASDTDFTLERETAVFFAPSGVPDSFCAYMPRYKLSPATTFGQPATATIKLPAAAPRDAIGLSDVTLTTFTEVAGTRVGNLLTVSLPHTGRFFPGSQYATGTSPSFGSALQSIVLTGNVAGLTDVKLRTGATYAATAPVTPGDTTYTFIVPDVANGHYDLEMVLAPWQCGDVPGGFTLGAAAM